MTRGPGWLFVGGVMVFALLGLLAASPPRDPAPDMTVIDVPRATDGSPRGMPTESAAGRVSSPSTRSPAALARAWGNLSANWSERTLPARLHAMASSASSTLAAELEHAVSATVQDGAGSEGSRGVVEAVVVRGSGRRRRVLVVTREEPSGAAAELAAERYRVYVGTAVRVGNGWRMERWQRQP